MACALLLSGCAEMPVTRRPASPEPLARWVFRRLAAGPQESIAVVATSEGGTIRRWVWNPSGKPAYDKAGAVAMEPKSLMVWETGGPRVGHDRNAPFHEPALASIVTCMDAVRIHRIAEGREEVPQEVAVIEPRARDLFVREARAVFGASLRGATTEGFSGQAGGVVELTRPVSAGQPYALLARMRSVVPSGTISLRFFAPGAAKPLRSESWLWNWTARSTPARAATLPPHTLLMFRSEYRPDESLSFATMAVHLTTATPEAVGALGQPGRTGDD